jgi:hypothetical protein
MLSCCESRCCFGKAASQASSANVPVNSSPQIPYRRQSLKPIYEDPYSSLIPTIFDRCGVGILFGVNIEGALIVAGMIPAGSAEQSGLVRLGE